MTVRRSAALVAALTVLAAILRIPGLNSGLWFDEIETIIESTRPPLSKVMTSFPGDYTHPFYGILTQPVVALLGEHAWTVRLPAVLLGVATVPMLYLLAAAVTDEMEALSAALLLAVSYHHVWFSQNARGYTLLAFATVASTLLFIRLVERPRRSLAVAYAVVVGLATYTHLTMAFVPAAHACVWGVSIARTRDATARAALIRTAAIALGGALVLSGILYFPMAAQIRTFFSGPHQRTAGIATPQWGFLELVRGLRVAFGTIGPVAIGILGAFGVVGYARRNAMALSLFLLPGLIAAAVILGIGAAMRPRFFFAFLGFAFILIVRGASEITTLALRKAVGDRAARVGAAVVVGAMAMVSIVSLGYNYRYPKQDFEGAQAYIEAQRGPGDTVLTAGGAMFPYADYYRTSWTALEGGDPVETLRRFSGRSWVVYTFPEYMNPRLESFLETRCSDRRIFPGTVGGGDVVVCRMRAE